jgi:hypothetical protein
LIISTQLTPNEARLLEDRDWIEGGDVLVASANSCIFDITKQEWFIPGQAVPVAGDGTAPDATEEEQEPDAAGADEGNTNPPVKPKPKPKPKPSKAVARLLTIANTLAERVMRKEAKGGIDAKFLIEVLSISKDKADEYVAQRSSLNEEEARAALIALAQGE